MKKILTLSFAFAFALFPNESFALTAPEEACKDLNPHFSPQETTMTAKEIEDAKAKWALPQPLDMKTYEAIFQKANESYHSYIGCMFEFAENTIYKNDAANPAGGVQANTPNTDVIDWMAPDQACLAPSEISKLISETTPTQMLGPILQTNKEYRDYLTLLGNTYSNHGLETDSAGNPMTDTEALFAKATSMDELGRERQVEIDSSMVAIDLMFHSLKELRLAFVMHVRFQCTLKFLDRYRAELGELRNLIQPLPGQLRDASITK